MIPQTFIFIGPSGSGKGTQGKLLSEYLKKIDPENNIFYLESGAKFRELIAKNTYTSELAKSINDRGELQPPFLAVHVWSHIFIEEFKGHEHVIVDGTPRTVKEAEIFDSAMKFYGKENVKVVLLSVSEEWAHDRLMGRHGRKDDILDEAVLRRLDWFKKDVLQTVGYLRKNPRYDILDINGEQSIEEVHQEILNKIKI